MHCRTDNLLEVIVDSDVTPAGNQVVHHYLAKAVFVVGKCQLQIRHISLVMLCDREGDG